MGSDFIHRLNRSLLILLAGVGQEEWQPLLEFFFRRGHRVITAPDGRSAADLADIHCYDLAILDVGSPFGLSILQDFNPQALKSGGPIILTATRYPDQYEMDLILGCGAVDCLVKPIDPVDLEPWLICLEAEKEARKRNPAMEEMPILDTSDLLKRTGGKLIILQKMAEAFRKEVQCFLEGSEKFSSKPLPEIRRYAHSLASMSSTLGLLELIDKTKEIDSAAGRGARRETMQALEELVLIIHQSLEHLDEFIAEQEEVHD
jgi:DNA-binding response OmpR family regulator